MSWYFYLCEDFSRHVHSPAPYPNPNPHNAILYPKNVVLNIEQLQEHTHKHTHTYTQTVYSALFSLTNQQRSWPSEMPTVRTHLFCSVSLSKSTCWLRLGGLSPPTCLLGRRGLVRIKVPHCWPIWVAAGAWTTGPVFYKLIFLILGSWLEVVGGLNR